MKMKVLFLTQIPSPYKMDFFDGVGKYCDLTVLFERESARNRDSEWLKKKPKHFRAIFLSGKPVGDEMAFCPGVLKYVLNRSYDRIVVGQYSSPTAMLAIAVMKLMRIRYYISTDGGMVKNEHVIKKMIKAFFIKNALAYFSPSAESDIFLISYGAKEDKLVRYTFSSIYEDDVLQQPVTHSEKSDMRQRIGITEEQVIVSVGQFIYRKGYDILLKALAELPHEIGVYIIGGEVTEEYQSLVQEYDLNNVHFLHFMNKMALKEYYMAADLFVLPTREDIWGLVINEALGYGLPIITTDQCNAGVELITNTDAGTIIPINDVTALKKAIRAELSAISDDVKQDKNRSALRIAKKNTIENMVKTYLEVLNKE